MRWKQYLPLSILGISFWFFLGFPFANYHESYMWIAQFNTNLLSDYIFQTIGHYSSYRPFGQASAILLYKLFSNSIIPFQLFNYGVIVLSFFILTSIIDEGKGLSIILTIIGGFFFIGFSFLFHLHGLYYSPLLLLISLIIYFYNKSLSLQNLVIVFIIVLITSLFHPYAIFIFIFYLIGLCIEKRKSLTVKYYLLGFSFILIGIVIINILVPDQTVHWEVLKIKKLLNIYKPLDKNLIMSAVSVLLSLFTIRSIKMDIKLKNYFSLGVFLLSVLFYFISVPVILAWFISSIIKMSKLKKWTMVFLILATFLFPVFTGFESRHLYFLMLIVCAYTVPINWEWLENKFYFIDGKKTIIILVCVLSLFLILKQDIHLPIISNIVQPLLAEKEKTYQLEEIIKWLRKSEYKGCNINFVSEYSNKSKTKNQNRSTERFPTTNHYINNYLNSIRPANAQQKNNELLFVCFSDCFIENAKLIYSVKGIYAGNASVFIPPSKPIR